MFDFTFSEKLQVNPNMLGIVIAATVLFLLTVLFAALSQLIAIPMMRHSASSSKKASYRVPALILLISTVVAFVGAVICVMLFVIISLYCRAP